MKIWITGSSGFIGQHLLSQFDSKFQKRTVIRIPHKDLYSQTKLKKLPKPDIIYHLAGYGNMAYQDDPQEIVKANVLALNNLLLAVKDIPFRAFINASSSSVYGEKTHPMHETNSLESNDYYGVTKIMGELLVRAYAKKYEKPVVSARLFSIYGPGEADFRFIPTAIRCIKQNGKMKLAPGMHDWVYIDDAIQALFLLVEHATNLKGKAINIGTGTQHDNYDVMKKLCDISSIDINTLQIEHRDFLRSRSFWVADNTLLKSLLWMPKYSLQEGLTEVWKTS